MVNKKLSRAAMQTIVVACVLLVIGILFSCSMAFGVKGISYLIGVALIVIGVLSAANSIIQKKTLLTSEGLMAAAITSFGVMFIVREMAGIIFDYIPWLMIAVGISIIIDSFLLKFVKKGTTAVFVVELVIGAVATALGFCIKFVNGWADYAALVLGIVLIVYAIFMIVSVLTKNK